MNVGTVTQRCRLIEECLGQAGYCVTTVGEGKAMRRALAGNCIDLVVLDLMLPGEDGLTLCRELRSLSDFVVAA